MRVTISPDNCEGHGLCALHATDVYELDDDGFAAPADFVVPRGLESAARDGALRCPMSAIKIVDE
ncbi:ferredoxin [Gordonia humi]|uniref:Ferredoxin n=1 Tax=Gordonia humi TaxID=686429 RepID=A0A840EY11_9ACTN|nr:ferredoxin [Gordonia humi]MBB4135173.1 ferredoxin [Gordonia humi]